MYLLTCLHLFHSSDMVRILDWEQWKLANHVPNRRRMKDSEQLQREVDAALEEDSSEGEMDDEDV